MALARTAERRWGRPIPPVGPTATRFAARGGAQHGALLRPLPRLGQAGPQRRLDDVELLRPRDQRRRELHDRVATIVGATDQSRLVQAWREEAAQQVLGLLLREPRVRVGIRDELEREEVARAAHVTDERDVA